MPGLLADSAPGHNHHGARGYLEHSKRVDTNAPQMPKQDGTITVPLWYHHGTIMVPSTTNYPAGMTKTY